MYETTPKSQEPLTKDHVHIRQPDAQWVPTTEEGAKVFCEAAKVPWDWARSILEGGGVVALTWGYLRKQT